MHIVWMLVLAAMMVYVIGGSLTAYASECFRGGDGPRGGGGLGNENTSR
jgi:hypothetical protein